MKIGVIADTHCHPIPKQLLKDFKNVDLIVHAGDFCSLDEVNELRKVKDVVGVCGNMDGAEIRKGFPEKQILHFEGVNIGVYHGAGSKEDVLVSVQKVFAKDKIDAAIYGHSHIPHNKKIGGVLYFNPGSPTDMVFAPYRSYGILDVSDGKITGEIIKVKD